MSTFDTGRRLCLLFEAGNERYALEAISLLEVAPPDEKGERIHRFLELNDLSKLLGGGPEVRPGVAVVLDVSPALALRVNRIIEVADVARDVVFRLPHGIHPSFMVLIRGAIMHAGNLYLELVADTLPRTALIPAEPRTICVLDEPPERGLVFRSQGRLFGVALPLVSHVVSADASFSRLPPCAQPMSGVIVHAQALWPIFSAPAFTGGPPLTESMFVLTEPGVKMSGCVQARSSVCAQVLSAATSGALFCRRV